jgi:hypothetical protein
MSRIAKLFPSNHLAALLELHPAPWHVARRRNLPIAHSEAVEVRDAAGQRVMEIDSSTVADGLVYAINGAYLCGNDEEPTVLAEEPTLLQIEPWRGQEGSDACA